MRDYLDAWVNPIGAEYRKEFHERTGTYGSQPLVDNPTLVELIKAIERHSPRSILEVGCGYGRLLHPITQEYQECRVMGCDISKDMMDQAPGSVDIFEWDICERFDREKWINVPSTFEVAFARGVFMYLEKGDRMFRAMKNLSAVISKVILVYEWPAVIEKMQAAYSDPLFEYHPILENQE